MTTAQPREHAVLCIVCKARTWNVSGLCDEHEDALAEPEHAA